MYRIISYTSYYLRPEVPLGPRPVFCPNNTLLSTLSMNAERVHAPAAAVGLAAATPAVAKSGGNKKPSAGHGFRSLPPPGHSSAPPGGE